MLVTKTIFYHFKTPWSEKINTTASCTTVRWLLGRLICVMDVWWVGWCLPILISNCWKSTNKMCRFPMQINWLSTNKTDATVRPRSRSSTEQNTEMFDFSTRTTWQGHVVMCDFGSHSFSFLFCEIGKRPRPLALYLYWLNSAPGLSRLRTLSPCHDSRGRGSWHHISAALAVSAWSCPTVREAWTGLHA